MKTGTITSQMPDGSVIIEYDNGYVFEGYLDANREPFSGVIKTPEGVKYDIPEFKENIYSVFELIKNKQLERLRINNNESNETH